MEAVINPEAPADRKSYNKGYYEKNREAIAERRRKKYEEDEEFRKKRLEWSRKYRERLQREREKRAERKGVEYVRRRGGPRKPVEVEIGGEAELAFTIRTLAKRTGRSLATIRSWRDKGLFPETPYRTQRGESLYTLRMIKALASVLRKHTRVTAGSTFRADVEKRWAAMGIPVGIRVAVSR